ncbi:unnamed protein product [Spirodela intermedia]|uniref:Uncharacterized protein n=1 Tax=Spirodela intermedia TaxID=51605 RepID=A0A7I8IBN6_SPIIN|nr:unnamed protein product [Spirodela intermedia]CAA6655119.1 unnamed protein product [Spirodela intermedia]
MARTLVMSPFANILVFFLCLSLVIVQGYVVREERPQKLGKEKTLRCRLKVFSRIVAIDLVKV